MGKCTCGVDIIEISRIRDAIVKNDRFCERIFTGSELDYFQKHGSRIETLAGFFAAKEAFSKYLGTGIRGFEFHDIEIGHDELGEPFVIFRNRKIDVSLSISHNTDTAVAVVCGEVSELSGCNIDIKYREKMRKLIPFRSEDANKGDCGRVFIIAGSKGMTGAATLCGYGALRCGSGLVTVGTAASEQSILACKLTEAMTVALPCNDGVLSHEAIDLIKTYAERADVVAIGPGLGRNEDIKKILSELIKIYEKTLIVDADGINALSENIDILKEKRCEIILTPHPGEMSRLTGLSVEEIQTNRERLAAEFAIGYGVCVVLKGKDTVIADKDGKISVNPTGNSGMATGGTGDVLCGVIAAFAAQGLSPYDAAVLGTYIHGLAGDIALQKKGIHGLIASDVADSLPESIIITNSEKL